VVALHTVHVADIIVIGSHFLMFAAEHTELDLEAFLVLNKRLVHVSDITITYSHVWVVVTVPCNGKIQGRLVHAQRLARLHADHAKEKPCLLAHVPNIVEHSRKYHLIFRGGGESGTGVHLVCRGHLISSFTCMSCVYFIYMHNIRTNIRVYTYLLEHAVVLLVLYAYIKYMHTHIHAYQR